MQPWPHDPQLAASLPAVLVHVPLQFVSPLGQPHTPLVQTPPVAHALPHTPQEDVDVFVFVSQPFEATPSQLPYPVLHEETPQAPAEQLAVALGSEHVAHVAPPVPQLVADWLAVPSQVFPLQQPVQPDDVLQTHAPLLQVCPLAHGPHVAPPVPQLVADWLAVPAPSHVFPLQQPVHDELLQTQVPLVLQVCPVAHPVQAAPFTPQVFMLDVWHFPVLSQHPEHDEESQTHWPLPLQC
jgi:hypothetical protein